MISGIDRDPQEEILSSPNSREHHIQRVALVSKALATPLLTHPPSSSQSESFPIPDSLLSGVASRAASPDGARLPHQNPPGPGHMLVSEQDAGQAAERAQRSSGSLRRPRRCRAGQGRLQGLRHQGGCGTQGPADPHLVWIQLQNCLPAEGAENPAHCSRRGWLLPKQAVGLMSGEQVSWAGNSLPSWRVGQAPVCFLRVSVSGHQ